MTDLNKEREEFESDLAEHLIERDSNGFYLNDEIQNYWEKHLLKVQIKELKAELEKAKAQTVQQSFEIGRLQDRITELLDERQDLYAQINNDQAVPEHIVTLQRNGEVFKFDLLDLLRRSLKSSKVLKTRENWSHVSKMVGLGSTTSTLLCKEMNVDPDGTVFVASESGAEQ
ncbi:hypothetical protein GD578_13400 [Acinetobacter nosocomialis]|uniref:Uncharacterized protein n=1 Tax=Acinetobacter nosocomialis TaxID=106654 RepID=A0AB37CW56_ACINO|nr:MULTISPECIES: hypothetical protein [Acinetobacter calcoaceticus/baumannii complex]QGA44756.1 hypothetical protein GD578_13400 [Acinetobacter nosocomialis]